MCERAEDDEVVDAVMEFYDQINVGSKWETPTKRADYRRNIRNALAAITVSGFRVSKSPK